MRQPSIALIGGTGAEGTGLAFRFCLAGYSVLVGSRVRERAKTGALAIRKEVPDARVEGMSNDEAARRGEMAVLTVPYANLSSLLPGLASLLAGKTVVSTITLVEFVLGKMVVQRSEMGSAAEEVQALLPESRVAAAFQTVDAFTLRQVERMLDSDVVVCADDKSARHDVMKLVASIPGLRPVSGGRLAHARYVEECTALLVALNRIHKSHAGIRLTGLDA